MSIPIYSPQNTDWKRVKQLGCFAIPTTTKMQQFLSTIHQFLSTNQLSQEMFAGNNNLFVDSNLQVVRSIVLNFDDKHPFSNEEQFSWNSINKHVQNLLIDIWDNLCKENNIKNEWTEFGNNSTGAHFYSKQRQSAECGFFSHIDSNVLVCNQPTAPGLEVWDGEQWIDAYLKDHIIVNIGLLGWIISDYKFNPCVHRVRTVLVDRSVVVFSPGILGKCNQPEFSGIEYPQITAKFFQFLDELPVHNMNDAEKMKQKIIDSLKV